MTTTPPISFQSLRPQTPQIVYSNHPNIDQYQSPFACHVIWWLENADIFLSVRGIVYGLRKIHFTQSPIFRRLLARPRLNNTPFGTTPQTPIPFDNIRPTAFGEMIYLLHISEIYKTNSGGWLQIFQIAKDWEMPQIARRATVEMDKMYFQSHPLHLRRWDVTLHRQNQERERRLRQEWIDRSIDYGSSEEETIFDLYSGNN